MVADPHDTLQRAEGRVLFGTDPSVYEAGRPDYPDWVYRTLHERCGLGPDARVLEVGPGTGLVTRHLLSAGASVTVVEPDPGLADVVAAGSPTVTVVRSSLEEAGLPASSFDLIVAATSFHWVDQRVGLETLRRCLKPGGWVAVWWTLFRDPSATDTFTREVEQILGPTTRGAFDEEDRPPFQLDREHRVRDLSAWGGLVDLTAEVVPMPSVLSTERARALYGSMATVLRRPPEEQHRLLDAIERLAEDRFGGTVERQFVTAMYTGRRGTA
jgi:SAM-dependent methyltransferase